MLEPVLTRLAYLCDFIPGHLAAIGEAEFAHRPAPDKWSKKEIIGHLLDSATNNHHRLVRAQFEDTPTITYDQIKWNSHGFYQQLATPQLIAFWAAYNTLPAPPKRKRGRPCKRGRPRLDAQKRKNRQTVRDARYLFLTRDANLDEKQRTKLAEALSLCPPLRVLRRFVLAIHELFGPTTTTAALAEARRQAILHDVAFKTTKGLEKGLAHLSDEDLFSRLTRYLDFEGAQKTSNHVERENREYRKRQKGCYRLRSLRSIRALVSLLRERRQPLRPHRVLTRRSPPGGAKEVSPTI